MAALYADENVAFELVVALRSLGHDVLTALEDARANQKIADPDVLARAISISRTVLTNNRRHYHKLHRVTPGHTGIITFTDDPIDRISLANRIDASISGRQVLVDQLIRVVRPNPSHKP